MVGQAWSWVTALAAFGMLAAGCSGRTEGNQAQGGSGTSGAAAAGGMMSASPGTMASGGMPAAAGSPAAGASIAGTSNVGEGGQLESAGAGGESAGGAPPDDILAVKPSPGCGKPPIQNTSAFVKYTLPTSGTKPAGCADSKCGAWSYEREYYVSLPETYQLDRAYPLVLEAPGCGGDGSKVLELSTDVKRSVIRVGLTPPPNEIGHATNPGQGCFDDKEGDDSVDFVFYEKLIDKLKGELCYDENRVFVAGETSGAWLANELGCKYAGNRAGYAIRGVAPLAGYLPTQVEFTPTCSDKPMAGIWVFEPDEPGDAFIPWLFAINRAMKVNGCDAVDYTAAEHEDYPIGRGVADGTCKKILGCAAEYPLVACALPTVVQSNIKNTANPAFATFLRSFEAP